MSHYREKAIPHSIRHLGRKKIWIPDTKIFSVALVGGWDLKVLIDLIVSSTQLKLDLPTGTELGKIWSPAKLSAVPSNFDPLTYYMIM